MQININIEKRETQIEEIKKGETKRKIWEKFEGKKKAPKCEQCGKFFKSERALHIHYIKAHNKGYA